MWLQIVEATANVKLMSQTKHRSKWQRAKTKTPTSARKKENKKHFFKEKARYHSPYWALLEPYSAS